MIRCSIWRNNSLFSRRNIGNHKNVAGIFYVIVLKAVSLPFNTLRNKGSRVESRTRLPGSMSDVENPAFEKIRTVTIPCLLRVPGTGI